MPIGVGAASTAMRRLLATQLVVEPPTVYRDSGESCLDNLRPPEPLPRHPSTHTLLVDGLRLPQLELGERRVESDQAAETCQGARAKLEILEKGIVLPPARKAVRLRHREPTEGIGIGRDETRSTGRIREVIVAVKQVQ